MGKTIDKGISLLLRFNGLTVVNTLLFDNRWYDAIETC